MYNSMVHKLVVIVVGVAIGSDNIRVVVLFLSILSASDPAVAAQGNKQDGAEQQP